MNKEDKYSNRMSLPKDGMTLAQKDYMFRVFRKQEYILFWSRKMKKLIYINYVGGAMILMSLSFAVLLYEVEYKKLESKFNKNQFCGIINSSFYAKKKGNI